MIAGNEELMVECLQNLHYTRQAIESLQKETASRYQITQVVDITRGELNQVLNNRLAKLEAQAQDLGMYGPGAKDSAKAKALATLHNNHRIDPQ